MKYLPFSLKISSMQKLFLINFEKDPDEIYHGFEPQLFFNSSYGSGLRIIAWRKDGYVDVYQQPELPKDDDFNVAAKGLGELIIHSMPGARFNVSEKGVDVYFAFVDKRGRNVEVEIVERNARPNRPFTLLAPVGSSSENPTYFPLYLMNRFDFVRRSHTDVKISIDGRLHKPDTFPFPMNGSRVYFMRYSADTFLIDWCPAYNGPLKPYSPESPVDISANISESDAQIISVRAEREGQCVSVDFAPPFPDITGLEDHTALEGQFIIKANEEAAGKISGTYHVSREDEEIHIKMHPSGGWEPKPDTLFLKFFYKAVSMFRNWPKTYQWKAMIKLCPGTDPYMKSKWERIKL